MNVQIIKNRHRSILLVPLGLALILVLAALRFPAQAQMLTGTPEPPRIPEVVYGGGLQRPDSLDGAVTEGFEDAAMPPTGWSVVETNPRENWEIKFDTPYNGTSYGAVNYDVADPQDEVLISPPFTGTNGLLTFWSFGSLNWCRDGQIDYCDFEVYYVNGDWDGGGGDDVLLGLVDEDWTAEATWSPSSFDLSTYTVGTEGRIAFRYVGQDGAPIGLDDVSITTVGEVVPQVYLPVILKDYPPIEPVDWTFLLYLSGDNAEEAAALDDFLEVSSVGSSDQVNLLVQLDRNPGYDTRFEDWSGVKRYRVTAGMDPTAANALVDLEEVDMASEVALVDFVTWGMDLFPADHYALVLWDHGKGFRTDSQGILDGLVFDETDGAGTLDMAALRSALDTLTGSGAAPLDLLGLDAGLTAMVEVDAQVRPYVELRVSPEDTTPADGWPYDAILSALVADPTQAAATLAVGIVNAYSTAYSGGQTQSAVDVGTPYDGLLTAVDDFAAVLIANDGSYHAEFVAARGSSQEFSNPDHIDLYDFSFQVSQQSTNAAVSTAASDLMDALTATLIAEVHGVGTLEAHGIGVYFPASSNSYDPAYAGVAGNLAFTANTQWDEWLLAYYQGGGVDSYEPDGNSLLATAIISGVTQTHSILPTADQDWVQFTLTERSGVVIETSGPSGDTVLWLYDGELVELEFDDDGGTDAFSRIDRVCGTDSLLPGTYFVRVEENGNDQQIASYDLSLSVTPCILPIVNGDFEQGQFVGWGEDSTLGYDLVTDSFPFFLTPHGGDWAAWLGGDPIDDETSIISQTVDIPSGENQLLFWFWIHGESFCGYSFAYVLVDADILWSEDLCATTSMNAWDYRVLDLSAYAGDTVVLRFKADTIGDPDVGNVDEIFIDDVDLVAPAALRDLGLE